MVAARSRASVRRARTAGGPRRPTGVRVSYPRCSARRSRGREAKSPFAAAFLSLLFPGLGHAYAGAYQRALGFAAPPILLVALLAGIVAPGRAAELIAFLLTPWVLPGVFVLNLLLLVYRLVAIVDAYRVTAYLNALGASGGGRPGPAAARVQPALARAACWP